MTVEEEEQQLWTFSLPAGFHLMSLSTSGIVTKDGSLQWYAAVRKTPLGQFRGGHGWTPQEAIDHAHATLVAALATIDEPAYNEPRITINLQHLLRRP